MENIFLPSLISLITLSFLEIILGIDNVIFIALLIQPLASQEKTKARVIGLGLALLFRILFLFTASYIAKLTIPFFVIGSVELSARSILFLIGGLFLIVKPIYEIRDLYKEAKNITKHHHGQRQQGKNFKAIISEIVFVDIILSFDSVLTAVAIADNFYIMVVAIIIAMLIMLIASKPVADFIAKNPNSKVIAIMFIMLVGIYLIAEGLGFSSSKNYLYVAMFFAISIEAVNMWLKSIRNKFNK